MSFRDAAARASRALATPRRAAAAWALALGLALAALAGAPGVSRDEAGVIAAAERGLAASRGAPGPLAPAIAAATHAVGSRAGLSHLRALRLGSALAGAALTALVALLAWELAGAAGALLAPALLWLAPRHLHAGLVATPDLAVATLTLAAALAWRAAVAGGGARRLRLAALAGLLVGGAMAARLDAWVLVPALALHAVLVRALDRRAARAAGARPPALAGDVAAVAVLAAVAAGVTLATAPALLHAGPGPWLPHPAGPLPAAALPLVAVPASILFAYAGGVTHALACAVRASRSRAPGASVSTDLVLLAGAAAGLAGAALAPAPPGARPWLHAAPFLALLGARTLLRACAVAWPARAASLAGAVALLVLYPGLRASLRAHPHGASAWNELAGGAPGGASLGLPRQDAGDAAAALLPAVNDRARPGARIWWAGVAPEAIAVYARDGRLRPDLAVADDPRTADLAVVAVEAEGRDAEYRAWSALRTARPAAGVYLDEVPVALVYARPGAWR